MRKITIVFLSVVVCLFMTALVQAQTYYPFPDTGQTKCYNNETGITCPQPGEPFHGQDAQYQPRLPRSYTKLGHGGTILADDALHVDDGAHWSRTEQEQRTVLPGVLMLLLAEDDVGPVHNITQRTFYNTIQEGIDASHPGDEIVVSPGTYQENIVLDGKSITLRSSDPEDSSVVASTVIDGGGNGDDDDVVTFQGAGASTIQGFTIRNGVFGILARTGSAVTITNNTITGRGIGVWDSAYATITNNKIEGILVRGSATITGNMLTGDELTSGISVLSGGDATITGNTFTGTGGISISSYLGFDSATAEITNNRITGGTFGVTVSGPPATAEITENEITGTRLTGIWVLDSATATITNNTIAENKSYGIRVDANVTVEIIDNTISDNRNTGLFGAWHLPGIPSPVPYLTEDWVLFPPEGVPYTWNGNTFLGNTINGVYNSGAHIW